MFSMISRRACYFVGVRLVGFGISSGLQRNLEGLERLVGGGVANLAKLQLRLPQHGIVEFAHVVVEVAGDGGVRCDGGGLEPKIVIVGEDLFVDMGLWWIVIEGIGAGIGIFVPATGLQGAKERPALQSLVVGCGGNHGIVGCDEMDNARVVDA